MKKNEYMTKQKSAILDYIKNVNDFTIKDIEKNTSGVGTTTIYRELNKLLKEKSIIKIVNDKGITRYQFINHCDCKNHIYLKCNLCGKTEHIDCNFINDFKNHIMKDHSFILATENLVVTGTCKKCLKG